MADTVLMALARAIDTGRVAGLRGATIDRWPDADEHGRLVVIFDEQAIEITTTVLGYVEARPDGD